MNIAARTACWSGGYVTNGLIAMWDCLMDNGDSTWTDTVANRVITFTGLTVTENGIYFPCDSSKYGTLGQADTDATFGIAAAGGCMQVVSSVTSAYNEFARTLIKSSADIGFSVNTSLYAIKGFGFRNTSGLHSAQPVAYNKVMSYTINLSSDGVSDAAWGNGTALTIISDYIGGSLPTGTLFGKRVDDSRPYYGTWYALRLYSRNLTATEIAANYAVDKARFGLT